VIDADDYEEETGNGMNAAPIGFAYAPKAPIDPVGDPPLGGEIKNKPRDGHDDKTHKSQEGDKSSFVKAFFRHSSSLSKKLLTQFRCEFYFSVSPFRNYFSGNDGMLFSWYHTP
jgi:hypothetical protein